MPRAQRRLSPEQFGPRSATQGYFTVPNSVAENLSLLTPAEKDLTLIIFRRGQGQTISEAHWKKWTGKEKRIMMAAVQGLRSKGLTVTGGAIGGKDAIYSFDRFTWDKWLENHPIHEKARTAGRKITVAAKAGMQVHPECRERGCQKACESEACEPKVISIDSFAQPVAQKSEPPGRAEPPPKVFPLTLLAIQKYFPMADEDFIPKLRAKISLKSYTDVQLAAAVHAAKKKNQESEGLFLITVPKALKLVCARPPARPEPAVQDNRSLESIQKAIASNAAFLRAADLERFAHELEGIDVEALHGNMDALESRLMGIEEHLLRHLSKTRQLSEERAAKVEKELKPYQGKMSGDQLARLRQQFTERALMEESNLPRLSLFYL